MGHRGLVPAAATGARMGLGGAGSAQSTAAAAAVGDSWCGGRKGPKKAPAVVVGMVTVAAGLGDASANLAAFLGRLFFFFFVNT